MVEMKSTECRVSYIDDVFIGADAIKPGHFVVGEFLGRDGQPPARVRKAHHGALRFAPQRRMGRSHVGQSSIRLVPG